MTGQALSGPGGRGSQK